MSPFAKAIIVLSAATLILSAEACNSDLEKIPKMWVNRGVNDLSAVNGVKGLCNDAYCVSDNSCDSGNCKFIDVYLTANGVKKA